MISIALRLRPFSHRPGTTVVIPKTPWQVQVFPTLLRFTHLISFETFEKNLDIQGPMLDFTVELDLEKCCVRFFGHAAKGYHQLVFTEKDVPSSLLLQESKERLSLGMHKRLDWELVCRRRDLKEIFPVWFRLGQLVPFVETPHVGTATLLQPVSDKLEIV